MRGLLSLDQELRAARRDKGQKNATQSNHPPDPKEAERPWQPDIDQVHQTMREVLRVIASLSGVELPGLPPGLQDEGAPPPRLDIKNLKDRFRNDLEGFSIKTTEELTKRAKQQTHAALDAVQNEVVGRIDQVAAELREQLQIPTQVEKLLEPLVGEAAARLETSLSQKVERLLAEREQLVHDRLQGALSPVQAQISAVEEAEARLETSLSQKVEQLFAEREQLAQDRLQGALSPVQAQISAVEEAEARLETSLSHKVERLFAEREQLAQDRLQGALSPVQAQFSAVEEAEARLETSLSHKVERLFAEREQLVHDRLKGALRPVQAQISPLEQTVQQICELKADSVAQLSTERPNAVADNAMKKPESSLNNGLNRFLDHTFTRIESSFNNFLEIPKVQPARSTVAGLEEQRKVIPFNNTDMQSRVEQALEQLGRLGLKNPHPASQVESLKATP
jgi:hypothetical protein